MGVGGGALALRVGSRPSGDDFDALLAAILRRDPGGEIVITYDVELDLYGGWSGDVAVAAFRRSVDSDEPFDLILLNNLLGLLPWGATATGATPTAIVAVTTGMAGAATEIAEATRTAATVVGRIAANGGVTATTIRCRGNGLRTVANGHRAASIAVASSAGACSDDGPSGSRPARITARRRWCWKPTGPSAAGCRTRC